MQSMPSEDSAGHTRWSKALQEKYSIVRTVVVSLEKHPRRLAPTIEVLPGQALLE